MSQAMRTLVLGLGNPLLTDDGVGWVVAGELSRRLARRHDIEIDVGCCGGLTLMERLVGYDRAIIVDSICTGARPGTLHFLSPGDISTQHSSSAHDANLATALALGRRLGAWLPAEREILLVAVEAADVETFGEDCTTPVREAVPHAVAAVEQAVTPAVRHA